MLPRKKKEVVKKIEDCFEDMAYELENRRFEPSERGAGTAPTEGAMEDAVNMLKALIESLAPYEIKEGDLTKELDFDTIVSMIKQAGEKCLDIADEFDELEEIDSFNRDNGETKYRYGNTVYKHKPSGRFLCVECQFGVGQWDGIIGGVSVNETRKKEIVTTVWE